MEGSLRDTVVVAGAVAGAVTQDPGLPQEDPRIGTFNFDIDTVMNKQCLEKVPSFLRLLLVESSNLANCKPNPRRF